MLTRRTSNKGEVAVYQSDLYSWRFLQLRVLPRSQSRNFDQLAILFCLITSGQLAEHLQVSIATTVDEQHSHGVCEQTES